MRRTLNVKLHRLLNKSVPNCNRSASVRSKENHCLKMRLRNKGMYVQKRGFPQFGRAERGKWSDWEKSLGVLQSEVELLVLLPVLLSFIKPWFYLPGLQIFGKP